MAFCFFDLCKVVESHLPSESPASDSQPLPAFQYFENVKNFLVAAEELKLTTFEAPVLERVGYISHFRHQYIYWLMCLCFLFNFYLCIILGQFGGWIINQGS